MASQAHEKGHPNVEGAPSRSTTPLLVIGFGNDLRGDDGAGQHVARRIRQLGLPGVVSIDTHQLLPELCEEIARCSHVVFVDATVHHLDHAAQVEPMDNVASTAHFAHSATPQGLIAMAEVLYGSHPEATIIQIRAKSMDFGEQLTPECEEGVVMAVDAIRALAAL